ncbi:MAG: RluA family pseudouridine synthase [Candidatus Hydrogenedentes bacterium]|nr:RluA family pseudouridine synthase [Candidatus Hydrogenedentota bacterium]
MTEPITIDLDEEHERLRLDVVLAELVEDASRSFVKRLVKDGLVTVNGQVCLKPARSMNAGERVTGDLPPAPEVVPQPEFIPLHILFEDADIIIINKPAGLVVHPAPGHATGTLVNAVLHHCPDFQRPGVEMHRPGIVHRLDRDTSGVMVVAKTQKAFGHLAEQASSHTFERRYLALVRGAFSEERGRISASIGRSLADRKRMAVTGVRGKEAGTNVEVLERYGLASLVALELETGRTHQIRVHLRFAGRPVLGDPVYGITDFREWPVPEGLRSALEALPGQALHAELLGIEHPRSGERLRFTAPPPEGFRAVMEGFREIAAPQ